MTDSESTHSSGTPSDDDCQEIPQNSTHINDVAAKSRRVSVHRHQISTTTIQEGFNELQGLDVQVYDQQAYERGVFDQVDRAISNENASQADQTGDGGNRSTNLGNFLNVIHSEPTDDTESKDTNDHNERDQRVIDLARQQRFGRPLKSEPKDIFESQSKTIDSLPKVPRISTTSSPERESDVQRCTTAQTYQPSFLVGTECDKFPTRVHREDDEESLSDEASGSDYAPVDESEDESNGEKDDDSDEDIIYETDEDLGAPSTSASSKKVAAKKVRKTRKLEDDGNLDSYKARMKAYQKSRAETRLGNIDENNIETKDLDELIRVEGSFRMPKEIWDGLFEHQRTGVQWLWELHQLGAGGILGDEMGLGKTIQVIAFLAALRNSNIVSAHKGYENLGPTVLVCPATVMHQWLLELRKWYPPFRVAILHSTGSFSGNPEYLVKAINKSRGILIVSYPGVVIYQDYLHAVDWHYAILDEGHKIRNPDAQVTLACKRFRTPHRIILSGSPVQNNLRELWSIFDFIYPGKLGTLPVFMEQFATPITQGGYANATDIQVQIAYKCACVLRDTIKPFLLRRSKAEVNNKLKLPDKSEQVLFCKLTEKQRKAYESYLEGPTVRDIKRGFCQIFVGLIQLRKICNHPDLYDATECLEQMEQRRLGDKVKHKQFFSESETYGHYKKSGKMMVVDALLKLWKKQNHKVLLFTQSRQMNALFELYLQERDYRYLIMDGTTPIGERQSLIEKFNKSEDIFIFLLTTRVGGVGVNLIGANRIIIYDPDWNPSTDIQARERAWRIGQQRHVIIYRLLTAGTIEEKIYHRQVFKLYLTNRILKDAKQKRFFKTNDLHELFRLGDDDKNIETKALFDDEFQIDKTSLEKDKRLKKARKEAKKRKKLDKLSASEGSSGTLSEEKLQEMREKAKRISQMIAAQYSTATNGNAIKKESESTSDSIQPKIKSENLASSSSAFTINQVIDSDRKEKGTKKFKYIVKQDVYRPGNEEATRQDTHYKKDNYILENLFKNSNISGALKHDRIESDSTSDFKVVESEAERVARDAINALRESRRMCMDSRSGIPNWTGRNGSIAANPRLVPKNKSRVSMTQKAPPTQQQPSASSSSSSSSGLSSASSGSQGDSLLSSIKKRNQSNPVNLPGHREVNDSDEEERDKDFEGKAKSAGVEQMADKIRDFVLHKSARSGEAQTQEMLNFFNKNFPPNKTAIFKAILYKMFDFQRRGDKGFWRLKSEFRVM